MSKPAIAFALVAAILVTSAQTPAPNTPVVRPAQGAAAPTASAFVVGLTRWSGGIEIVGRYTGERWVNTWPPPVEPGGPVPALAQIPAAWLAKSVPRDWHVWGRDGASFVMRVNGTRRGVGESQGCTQPLVLTLDTPTGVPRDFFDDLIAIDTPQPVERVEPVLREGTEWLRLEPVIRSAVLARQAAMLSGGEWTADVRARVASAPVRVESLIRASRADLPLFAYYFSATKRIEHDGSTLGFVVSGWILAVGSGPESPSNARTSNVKARRFGGEEDSGRALEPLAIFRVGTRVFWLVSVPGYEWVTFVFVEVTPANVRDVLTTDGGGC